MAVQQQTDIINHPLIVSGTPITKRVSIADNDARSGAIVVGTVMAHTPGDADWTTLTDVTASDGTQYPSGIILDALTEAEVIAGPVANVSIIVGGIGLVLNEDLITFENSLTKASVITVPTSYAKSAEQVLAGLGIYLVDTQEGTSYEAA